MKRLALALALVAGLVVVPIAAAQADEPEDPIYLSLGTSLAAGTLADSTGASIPFSDESYTDEIYEDLVPRFGGDLEHVKLGCPGETSATFVTGGICGFGLPHLTYDTGSQLGDALQTLATGRVVLVTIDLGANDVLQAQGDIQACFVSPDPDACLFAIYDQIAQHIAASVAQLRAAAPDVPIVAMNYYNPQLASWLGFGVPGGEPSPELAIGSDLLVQLGNAIIGGYYSALGVPVADVYTFYHSGDFDDRDGDTVPNNVEAICFLTSMCPKDPAAAPNIHANPRGYEMIARAFMTIVKAGKLVG